MTDDNEKCLHPINESACDKEFRLGNAKIKCISGRKAKEIFKPGNAVIIGEITGKAEADDKYIHQLSIGRHNFDVATHRSHNRFLYANQGFIQIGDDEFIAVLSSRIPFFAVLIVLLLCLGIIVTALLNLPKQKVIEPYNRLPEKDVNAEKTGDEGKTDTPKDGKNSVSMIYSLDAKLILVTGEIEINFRNPSSSTQAVCLILGVIDENGDRIEIARSGAINPGYGLKKMTFNGEAMLYQGIYKAFFSVPYYNYETGERSVVSYNIEDVTLTVTNS